MTTSANVIEYTIFDLNKNKVGHHYLHFYCKPRWEELLKFQPLEDYTIMAWGYDEEEEYWEDEPINLKKWFEMSPSRKKLIDLQ